MCFGTDPNVSAQVQWYFCEPGAKDLGFPTPFVSRNYCDKGVWPDLGEVEAASRPWRNGSFPIPVDGQGEPCGSRSVWDQGWSEPVPVGLNRNDFGLAWCCADQSDLSGNPLLTIIPNDLIHPKARHTIRGVVAVQRGDSHEIHATIANRVSLTHNVRAVVAMVRTNVHEFHAVISAATLAVHTFRASIKQTHETVHAFASVVAKARTAAHEFHGFLGAKGEASHTFNAVVCPTPGATIFGPSSGFWQAPPAVQFVSAFLWGEGGNGAFIGPFPGDGSGGGAGGYTQVFAAAVTPLHFYVYRVEPGTGSFASEFFTDFRHILAVQGTPGEPSVGGNGGTGVGGDQNYVGGDGGTPTPGGPIRFGGGGGQSAGPFGNGANGGNGTSTGPGGFQPNKTVPGYGGAGGNPLNPNDGHVGGYPGGGGGGAGWDFVTPMGGGAGAGGRLIITWYSALHFFNAVVSGSGTVSHDFHGVIADFLALTGDDEITYLTGDDDDTLLTGGQ